MDIQESFPPHDDSNSDVDDRKARLWGMFLHLSVFTGYAVPILGLLAPILIWQIKKETLPQIDEHGKHLVNWLISLLIYGATCALLSLIVIGIPLLILLGLLSIIFPIIAGIKANQGEVWKYPLSISFLQ